MGLTVLKRELIEKIKNEQDAQILLRILTLWENLPLSEDDKLKVFRPMRKEITVEELIKEQNYQGFNREEFDKLAQELDIQEPIEELLTILNKN